MEWSDCTTADAMRLLASWLLEQALASAPKSVGVYDQSGNPVMPSEDVAVSSALILIVSTSSTSEPGNGEEKISKQAAGFRFGAF